MYNTYDAQKRVTNPPATLFILRAGSHSLHVCGYHKIDEIVHSVAEWRVLFYCVFKTSVYRLSARYRVVEIYLTFSHVQGRRLVAYWVFWRPLIIATKIYIGRHKLRPIYILKILIFKFLWLTTSKKSCEECLYFMTW